MNQITKAILDYYQLEVNERFKVDNSNFKGIYFFDEHGELCRETNNNSFENVSREILGRLAYGITVFKLGRNAYKKKNVEDLDYGDTYYFIDDEGGVFEEDWDNDYVDKDRLKFGNVFITEEEAKFECERRKIEAQLLKYGRREFNNKGENFLIYFNSILSEVDVCGLVVQNILKSIYFDTREIAEKAINEIGEDKIKKYFFGVENEQSIK